MKTLKNLTSRIFWMLVVCMTFFSCTDDDNWEKKVVEGLPVSLSFEITTPAPIEVETRATDEQETNIEKLALFFYADNTSLPIVYEVPLDQLSPVKKPSTTNYFYNISVPENVGLTSGDWYVYAVANWDKGFWDNTMTLDQLSGKTKSEMDQFCIQKKYQTLEITETAILLTGKYGETDGKLTLERTSTNNGVNTLTLPIKLKRSVAKIIFNFLQATNGAKFTPVSFDIHNYSRSATFFERSGWTSKANPNGIEWAGIDTPDNFSFAQNQVITGNSFMFYMPENVQIGTGGTPENVHMREKMTGENFTYAPKNSTYVVVSGKYEGPGENGQGNVEANVRYTIHLGDFSAGVGTLDNFTVRRGTKYTYNVTVAGVDKIIIEARTSEENQPGAEGDVINTIGSEKHLLDSHYETCIIKIPVGAVENKNRYGLVLRTPKSNFLSSELKKGDLKQGDTFKEDVDWIEFYKPATSTTLNAYPGKAKTKHITDLFDLFKNPEAASDTEKPFIVEGGYIYMQAFVKEYYYDNYPLENFVNADNRVMILATSTNVSKDGKSTYTETPIFNIEQRSIKSMYDLKVENPFGIETTEESEKIPLYPGYPDQTESSQTQSGHEGDNKSGADHDDGWTNFTGNIVAGDAPGTGDRWDKYIDIATHTMKPEYNGGLYEALLRNRDENGDGMIQKSEIKWFLPSVNQYIAIWNGYHALNSETRQLDPNSEIYYTSTNGIFRSFWAHEGAFGYYKGTNENEKTGKVRCIRALNLYNLPTNRSTVFDPETNTFNVTGFDTNAVRPSGSQKGAYTNHSQFDIDNKLPEAFQMAKSNYDPNADPSNYYVPKVTFELGATQDNWSGTRYELTIHITNIESGRKYRTNTSADFNTGTDIADPTEFIGVVEEGWRSKDLYIIAENGNYTRLYYANGGIQQEVKDVNSTTGTGAGEYTAQQLTEGNILSGYYENPDKSDMGEWRVPNQRELMVMILILGQDPAYQQELEGLGSCTWYKMKDGKNRNIFFVASNNGLFVTSAGEKDKFKIRPVRDVAPKRNSNSDYDSGYTPGGNMIH